MIHFTLYSRSYCHLCDDMRVALERNVAGIAHDVSVLDIDQDAKLLALYDEVVPVLFGRKSSDQTPGPGQQLCHYFLDAEIVKAFCNE